MPTKFPVMKNRLRGVFVRTKFQCCRCKVFNLEGEEDSTPKIDSDAYIRDDFLVNDEIDASGSSIDDSDSDFRLALRACGVRHKISKKFQGKRRRRYSCCHASGMDWKASFPGLKHSELLLFIEVRTESSFPFV